jgi:hypothetical protein
VTHPVWVHVVDMFAVPMGIGRNILRNQLI